jgi:hypothetical protein
MIPYYGGQPEVTGMPLILFANAQYPPIWGFHRHPNLRSLALLSQRWQGTATCATLSNIVPVTKLTTFTIRLAASTAEGKRGTKPALRNLETTGSHRGKGPDEWRDKAR